MVSFTVTVGKGHEISVESGDLRFWREPLVRPFGFKGGYLTELWQAAVTLRGGSGAAATGLGTQSVLWSDAEIFASRSETEGNELMLALTRRAVELARGRSFATPFELLDEMFPEVLEYGKRISGRSDLRPTFALNALVAFDNAVWTLYARENGFHTLFDATPEGLEKMWAACARLEEKEHEVSRQIAELKAHEPFTYMVLLEDEELLKQKQNDLKTKIADLEAVIEKYERMWNNG